MSSGDGKSKSMPTNMNNNIYNSNVNRQQSSFLPPPDPNSQIRQPDCNSEFLRKRSVAEFLAQNPQLRNVKSRPNNYQFHHASPLSPVDLSTVLSSFTNSQYGLPTPNNSLYSFQNPVSNVSEKEMMADYFKELEEELLRDIDEESQTVSINTNSEWSHSQLIPTLMIDPVVSPTPTSSSYSSSCSSTSASAPLIDLKQSLIDAAVVISEGKQEIASEILTRLQQFANASGNPEQRLVHYMIPALSSRLNCTSPVPTELCSKEHMASTHLLYDVSTCFKLGFMVANLAIIEATWHQGFNKIHVVDFEIGRGKQYVHLLHSLAAAMKGTGKKAIALKISAFAGGSTSNDAEEMKAVGASLKALAQKLSISFDLVVRNFSIADLSRENLQLQFDEALVFNFAFNLYKLPDESVTMENQRDVLLRRVKTLSPTIVTVIEQEINTNTAPLAARVREAFEHYSALFDSLDATIGRDISDRLKIEEGLGRKLVNSIACEGEDRVERCEVFGKWRTRMSMAGFEQRHLSQLAAEWLRSKLESRTCGNPGFTVAARFGAFCFGWMGQTLDVVSAWR